MLWRLPLFWPMSSSPTQKETAIDLALLERTGFSLCWRKVKDNAPHPRMTHLFSFPEGTWIIGKLVFWHTVWESLVSTGNMISNLFHFTGHWEGAKIVKAISCGFVCFLFVLLLLLLFYNAASHRLTPSIVLLIYDLTPNFWGTPKDHLWYTNMP